MAPHNIVTIYKEWVNSILCECGLQIQSISQLNTHNLLLKLYELLTNYQNETDLNLVDSATVFSQGDSESITSLLRLLRADGIRTTVQPSDLISGDFNSLLEIVWILILNYSIHCPGESSSHQRTPSIGTKLLLRWCSELLGGVCFDYRLSMTENMEKDVLHNIINNVTTLVSKEDEPEPCDYHEAIVEAERRLGVSSNLIRVCDNQTENLAVTVYISLLRRKRELIKAGHSPTLPTVLVDQQETQSMSRSRSRSCLSAHNEKTQQVLMDIERQLGLYQNGFTSSRISNSLSNPLSSSASKYQPIGDGCMTGSDQSRVPSTCSTSSVNSFKAAANIKMPSPITRAHGSFPNESYNGLKIDLQQLQQHESKRSVSSSTTPRQHGGSEADLSKTAEFNELLRQLKHKEKNGEIEKSSAQVEVQPDEKSDEDDGRHSPKSAPNTDEGFGTFTKTTPRGKDSASEGSNDHTDCEVDHLSGEQEPCSITEWWDKVEMPADITIIDSTAFQGIATTQSVSKVEEGREYDLVEDELMYMLDNIGMNGIKATSGLASAQETELRLLHILKERDDLVLSYHSALKELSKLTARMKDENHMLRQQLNMTDLSHNEIVLALEEQASDGRQLALSLQEDLTDTEVNVLARLREDKLILEDRLAALEHQYNCDLAKWKSELSIYKSKAGLSPESNGVTRENQMLKLQLEEMRSMFDVTVNQTQEECNSYLQTIERLKSEISNSKSPMSDVQLDAVANRQAEMERLYESMIHSLEGDNSKLAAELEELQKEVEQLKLGKQKDDKCCGTSQIVSDSGVGTDCAPQVNRSMNTSLCQSVKGTSTDEIRTAVKCVATDEDAEIVALKKQIADVESIMSREKGSQQLLERQNSELLDNHKRLVERLATVESQLQVTQHKFTTLQTVHNLVIGKNESLEKELSNVNGRLTVETSNIEKLRHQLTEQLEKSRRESLQLSEEVSSLHLRMESAQQEVAFYRQREVELSSELTQLTQERSDLQGKVNSLNSDMVHHKAQYMSQVLRVQQLEAAKAGLESQTEAFKQDSLELFKQLNEARQQKDDLHQQLESLHSQLNESVSNWKDKVKQQETESNQSKAELERQLSVEQTTSSTYKSELDKLGHEVNALRQQVKSAADVAECRKQEMNDVIRTAKLDANSGDVLEQLNSKLKSLQQQNAEYRFTTTHFRSENSQLQLRVNQLEELNRATEQRNAILQKELSTVQASLDDSYSSADAQLNLLDLSSSDLMSLNDTSELRNYILAAKRQLEMMQNKRAKTNIEYSRKIAEMETLVKGRSASSSDVPSTSDTDSKKPQSISGSDYMSSTTDFVKLPPKLDMSSSYSSAAVATDLVQQSLTGNVSSARPLGVVPVSPEVKPVTPVSLSDLSPISRASSGEEVKLDDTLSYKPVIQSNVRLSSPYLSSQSASSHDRLSSEMNRDYWLPRGAGRQILYEDLSDIELPGLPDLPDSLSRKVHSLTNRTDTSTPTHNLSPNNSKNSFHGSKLLSSSGKRESGSVKMSAIESENAALRAELEFINSDRTSLHKHMEHHISEHDALNETLDELERSLEEVYDSNKLLKDTLGDCNEFIQTNILHNNTSRFHRGQKPSQSTSARSRSVMDISRPRSVASGVRPHSVAPVVQPHHMTSVVRPHSVTPHHMTSSVRPHSVTPHHMTSSARPHSVTPTTRSHNSSHRARPHSTTPSHRATPFSVTFGSNEINTYYENEEKAGWSAQSDMNLTSSSEFNKLQQTNVSNYDCLLNSDTNSKSPSRRPPSASKATDLNHIIQHSLNRLNQINSDTELSSHVTSAPSRTSKYSSSADETDSEDEKYITANQHTPLWHSANHHTHVSPSANQHTAVSHLANQHTHVSHSANQHTHASLLATQHTSSSPFSKGDSFYTPERTPNRSAMLIEKLNGSYQPKTIENSLRSFRDTSFQSGTGSPLNSSTSKAKYNDGGPGPDEVKAVLPEPNRSKFSDV